MIINELKQVLNSTSRTVAVGECKDDDESHHNNCNWREVMLFSLNAAQPSLVVCYEEISFL